MSSSRLTRITWLKAIVTILVTIGISFSCTPFFKSLAPPVNSSYKWNVEINLSDHEVGQLKSYEGISGPIWVYRRTAEQIAWLKNHQPPVVEPFILKYLKSMEFNGKYRSINKEYFVFSEWRLRNKTYLQEGYAWYYCGTLKYIEGDQEVQNNSVFKGLIACSSNFDDFKSDGWGFIYDVAGNASSHNIVPLQVPYYEFNKKGNLIITPFPRML